MNKSDFDYDVIEFDGKKAIWIIDLDKGGMSVTNNIENVVKQIETECHIDANDYLIVYQDSTGYWDGYNNSTQQFDCFRETTSGKALAKYILLMNQY